MDSSRKRKAADHPSSGSTTKKIKLLNTSHAPATPTPSNISDTAVQQVGLKLINQLRNAADKTGRPIADNFYELPSRDELPEYYDQIRLPISINTIEAKLKRNGYPTVTTIESDVKRMIQNAKDFNLPRSEIYEDAERMRKLVYNFMKVNNPQYKWDPNYSSFPTPLPNKLSTQDDDEDAVDVTAPTPMPKAREMIAKPRRSISALKASEPPSERKASTAPSGTNEDSDADGDAEADSDKHQDINFTGKSMQEAQQMIITNLLNFTDNEGLEIFTPFANLPSRSMTDYYQLIRHPVSIKGVQKRVRGIHGRAAPTYITDFKTWDAFSEAVSFIWRNAREYNEDGSDIYELAGEFEDRFKALLAEAREKVDDPASTRIKLGGPKPKSGITLNLSGGNRPSPVPGVTIDNEALARQRQMVQAGVNGQPSQARPNLTTNGSSSNGGPNFEGAIRRPSSTQASVPPQGVKNERLVSQSPAPNGAAAVQPLTNGIMPPPVARPVNGSPMPPPLANGGTTTSYYHYTAPSSLIPTAIRTYPLSKALLPMVTIATQPRLNVASPYNLSITPHPTLAEQNATMTLPSTHFALQISPTISRDLSMDRAYRVFVLLNGTKLTQQNTQLHIDSGRRTHTYDGNLAAGVNRIEIIVAATAEDHAKDKSVAEAGKNLDIERVTVYANLLR